VYLYISSSKVVGCIVVESISQANLLLLQEPEVRKPGDNQRKVESPQCNVGKTKNNSSTRTLAFGNITFNREVVQRRSKSSEDTTTTDVFSNIAVPAVCGIRGLWVSRKVRRQGIATRLLDAVR
jgi:ribosomal protein S18 acetylase RimI-like enzyme